MLQIIKDQHAEQRHLVRDEYEEQSFFPIQEERRSQINPKHEVLRDREVEPGALHLPLLLKVITNRFLLKEAADGWIRQQHRQVVLLSQPICNRVITFPVVKGVVIHVVSRNPSEHWKAV